MFKTILMLSEGLEGASLCPLDVFIRADERLLSYGQKRLIWWIEADDTEVGRDQRQQHHLVPLNQREHWTSAFVVF